MWRGTLLLTFALGLMCLPVWARRANPGGTEPHCGKYVPPVCTREYNPLCGTDGRTYSNECMLCMSNSENSANVLIKRHGEC